MKLSKDFFVYFAIIFIALDIALTAYLLTNIDNFTTKLIIAGVNISVVIALIAFGSNYNKKKKESE